MNARIVSVMLAVFLAPLVSSTHSQSSGEVVIDGAKNPELFPEWFVWEQTLQTLPRLGRTGKTTELDVSRVEWALIQREIKVFQELQTTQEKQHRQIKAAGEPTGKTEDQIRNAAHLVDLEYRHKVLDIAHRVSEGLSPESLTRLRAWIDVLVQGTAVHLRGRAIKLFREPR